MKKKIGIIIALFACTVLFFSYNYGTGIVSAQPMSAITSDSIKEKETQIKQAQNEKKELQNTLSDLKNQKNNLEAKKANLKKYVEELDSTLFQIEQSIAELKQKIAYKESEIAEAEADLQAALERENHQKEAMIDHIRMVYESGENKMTDMLLKSESFGDFLNKADYVERVISYERVMWQDFIRYREYSELCKEELEIEKEILDEANLALEEEQSELEALIEQKTRDIVSYESDIKNQETAIREYEEEIRAQEEEISTLEALIAEEKKRLLAQSGVVLTYDGGVFKFPLATYTRVSDDYGDRMHPTLHVQQFHNGVDFAAPKGTAIYAAYDGVVVAATYSATMGNYVMIDHGDSLYTIYMHASALYVSKDDVVVRGETIAAVGSTGRSTGNHLHFSVRLNGEYQSPWNYLSQ